MKPEDFLALQDGDRVRFIAENTQHIGHPPVGSILTRKHDWLDDEQNARFDYEGGADYHFFYSYQVELIEGD